ncbi:MAG TPA: RNA polymerase sigma factor, partial [Polyangiaceae bacterium]
VSLVERCMAGEPVAWKTLHHRYFPIVQTFLRRLGTSHDELDDLTQEVFLRTFQFLKSFRGEADLRTWLYRLCLTTASRRHRKRKVQEALLFWLRRDDVSADRGELVLTPELEKQMFERALNHLGAGERAVFVLYELEGVSGKEIAEIVGCPEATVWRRLHYARQTFRKELERMGALG